MKITGLRIDGFGVWSGLSLSDFSEQITLVYGRNEAGKTTLLETIRSILYGISSDHRRRYLPPLHGGLPGGSISVRTGDGPLEVQRTWSGDDPPGASGDVTITAEGGTAQGEAQLARLLDGMDEATFRNVFAFGLRDLQQLATLNETSAARYLYNLTSGLDRISLAEVLQDLARDRARILSSDDDTCQIAYLFEEHERLETEIEELLASGGRWIQAYAQQRELVDEISELQEQADRLEREGRLLEVAFQVQPQWAQKIDLDQRLEQLGIPAEMDESSLDRLRQFTDQLEVHRQQVEQIRRQQRRIRDEAKQVDAGSTSRSDGARIEALGEQASWIASLETQVGRLRQEIDGIQTELKDQCELSGLVQEPAGPSLPDITPEAISLLRSPGSGLREAASQVRQMRQQLDQSQQETLQLDRQINAHLEHPGKGGLATALEAAGACVSRLRRRIQVEHRIDQLTRAQHEVDQQIDELLQRNVLPGRQLLAIGIPFAVGLLLIFVGLFWPRASTFGWPLAVLGLAGWIVAVYIKYQLAQDASRELDSCHRQVERIREQTIQAKQQRKGLDDRLSEGGGPWDVRLQSAQQKLEQLERLLPIEAQRKSARQKTEDLRARCRSAESKLREARQPWQNALKAAGLPTKLMPNGLRDVVASLEKIADLRQRLAGCQREFEQRQQELRTVAQRVQQLSQQVGLPAQDGDLQRQIQQLLEIVKGQRQQAQHRRKLVTKYRQLGKRKRQHLHRIHQQRLEIDRILALAGVRTEEPWPQVAARFEEFRQLRQQRQELMEAITAASEPICGVEDIEQRLSQLDQSALEAQWDTVAARLEQIQSQRDELHQQQGQLIQEMKTLGQDRRLDDTRLELESVKQRLKDAVRRWQVLAVASRLLDTIRKDYEIDRQPETLRLASQHLAKLTQQRYRRIWTPLGLPQLNVDDQGGRTLPLEVLSQGTREAIYLSLRLALIEHFSQQRVPFPLVLDDVLVNFDTQRLQAAAKTLSDFAQSGHQVLLFTCHEHVVRAFKSVKAEIRVLPDHTQTALGQGSRRRPPTPASPSDDRHAA